MELTRLDDTFFSVERKDVGKRAFRLSRIDGQEYGYTTIEWTTDSLVRIDATIQAWRKMRKEMMTLEQAHERVRVQR